jgi:hypothetical protein
MKIGDLVLNPLGETAILLTEPRLSEDCSFAAEFGPDETYYVADVLLTEFGCKDIWITDDLEIIDENR